MLNKIWIAGIFFLSLSLMGLAQNCDISVRGEVIDEGTNQPLSQVNILVIELDNGTATDKDGKFELRNLCVAEYHLIVTHVGCDPQVIHLNLERDTVLRLNMQHTPIPIEDVVIKGNTNLYANQSTNTVRSQSIEDNLDENFSDLLRRETGVHILRNGTGISKPVVHGLFGNRLTILNNGIPQSGQQWGNDHSPEIDAAVANDITVLKGAAALEYGGSNMGSIILLKPGKIEDKTQLQGRFGYAYETNGRGNSLNLQLQKKANIFAWRATGTFKKYGDRKTSDYFLNNTGNQELNFAFQAEKSWDEKYYLDVYASTFNSELGILRGSHIANTTDLEFALDREIPFFTEDEFSFSIDAPKQKVNHHLIKASLKNFLKDNKFIELTMAGQLNNRKEFDVRRGDRSEIPALSLEQYSLFSDLKFQNETKSNWTIKVGNQTTITDNTNIPETDILPLIPDYISFRSGIYTTASKTWKDNSLNMGLRYDHELQKVVAITNTFPREIVRYQNNFNNFSGIIGFSSKIAQAQRITLTSGYSMRNPAVNELYSNGLHQGVSGIESGDPNLSTEKALKSTVEYKVRPSSKFSFESLFYFQSFKDYIYLQPQDEVELTIRGAFPVFKYEQTDATIFGLDLSTQFVISSMLSTRLGYSFIKGKDNSRNIPLINIPPNSFDGAVTYQSNNAIKVSGAKVEGIELELNNRYVFQQKNLLESQDFILPPKAYNLIGFKASANLIFSSYKLRFLLKVENIMNIQYRDYLNRQRYFADDLGRSVILGLNFKF